MALVAPDMFSALQEVVMEKNDLQDEISQLKADDVVSKSKLKALEDECDRRRENNMLVEVEGRRQVLALKKADAKVLALNLQVADLQSSADAQVALQLAERRKAPERPRELRLAHDQAIVSKMVWLWPALGVIVVATGSQSVVV